MTIEEKLEVAMIALQKIKDFDHIEECDEKYVPVHECCCYDEPQWKIAASAIEKIKLQE